MNKTKIDIVECYRIIDFRGKAVFRRSKKGAANVAAWSLIWQKYAPNFVAAELLGMHAAPKRFDACLCEISYPRGFEKVSDYGCPIHDKKTGYFKRLHERLSAAIEAEL